jgi:putative transposase
LRRAVDQHDAEFDILLQERRDTVASKQFFRRVLAACPEAPCKIVIDQLRGYFPVGKRL